MGGKLQAKCNFVFVIKIIYWGQVLFLLIFAVSLILRALSVHCKLYSLNF